MRIVQKRKQKLVIVATNEHPALCDRIVQAATLLSWVQVFSNKQVLDALYLESGTLMPSTVFMTSSRRRWTLYS